LLKSKINNRIILALDVPDVDRAIQIASATAEYVDAIKIGLPIGLRAGLTIIDKLRRHTSLPIIADIKISDVPEIAGVLARTCFDFGFDAVTVQGFVGPSVVKECVRESKAVKDVIVITEMTHPDAQIFMQPLAEEVADMARKVGASGIQTPGTRPERVKILREKVGEKMLIVSCGIGAQGGAIGSAIRAGADFEIIGRIIYTAANPKKIAMEISQELKTVARN